MKASQTQLDLRKEMEARFDQWAKDTVWRYEAGDIPPTTALSDIVGCLVLNLTMLARELKLPPHQFCGLIYDMMKIAEERNRKNDNPST